VQQTHGRGARERTPECGSLRAAGAERLHGADEHVTQQRVQRVSGGVGHAQARQHQRELAGILSAETVPAPAA
jgi:hypothetical protein